MTNNEKMILFREICMGIPANKFDMECLVDCESIDDFDLNDMTSFNGAHPIVWAAETLGYDLDGDLFSIVKGFCHDFLGITTKKMVYLFMDYNDKPDKDSFLKRLFYITAKLR